MISNFFSGFSSIWNSFQITGPTGTSCALQNTGITFFWSKISVFLPFTAILKYHCCLVQELSLFLFWAEVIILCRLQTLHALSALPNVSQPFSTTYGMTPSPVAERRSMHYLFFWAFFLTTTTQGNQQFYTSVFKILRFFSISPF